MNLIAVSNTASNLVEGMRATIDIVGVYFSKAFHTLSYNVLTDKLMKYRLDKWSVWSQAQRIVISICHGQTPDGNFSTTQPLAHYLLFPWWGRKKNQGKKQRVKPCGLR